MYGQWINTEKNHCLKKKKIVFEEDLAQYTGNK